MGDSFVKTLVKSLPYLVVGHRAVDHFAIDDLDHLRISDRLFLDDPQKPLTKNLYQNGVVVRVSQYAPNVLAVSELIAKRRHWSSHQYFCVAHIPLDKWPDTNRVVRNLRQGRILRARDAGYIVKASQNEFEPMVCFSHEAEKKEDMVVLKFFVGLLLNEIICL